MFAYRFKNKYVDRVWLVLIGLAFLMWLAIMVDRMGAPLVFGGILLAILIGAWRS